MAKGDILVRFKADTTNYDPNIAKAKRQLEGFTKENLTAGGALKQLTSGLVSTAAKFASLGAAAAAAMKVVKDAFMASEANVDEWGRVMDASRSLYEGFLNSINNGDVSGFLSRIDQIVQAAREAYNELDRLGTLRTIQAPKVSAQQSEIQRMQAMLRTGHYIAPAAGTGMTAAGDSGRLLTPKEMKAIEEHLKRGMDNMVRLVGNEVKQTGKAIDAVYNRFGAELGMSVDEFRKGTSSMAEFDKRMQGYEQYKQWDSQARTEFARQGGRGSVNFDSSNPFAAYRKWGTFRVDGQRYGELVQLIQQRDQQAANMYGQQATAYRTINRANGVTVAGLMGRGGGGGAGGGNVKLMDNGIIGLQAMSGVSIRTTESMKELQAEFARFRDMMANATNSAEYGTAQAGMSDVQRRMGVQEAALRLGVSMESYLAIQDDMQTKLQEIADDIEPIEIKATVNQNTFKLTEEEAEKAAQAIGSIGSALQSIEDPSAKVAGLIATAIANIAATFAGSLKGTFTPWDWIAGAAAGTATMISTIAAIKSATAGSYATGGIIPGNSLSGDNQMAQVNAGEVILTRAQAGIIAGALNGGNTPNNLSCEVSGEQLRFVLNANSQRRGRGEYVTSGSRY